MFNELDWVFIILISQETRSYYTNRTLFLSMKNDHNGISKGFDISYDLLICGCRFNMPPFVKGGHMSKANVTK